MTRANIPLFSRLSGRTVTAAIMLPALAMILTFMVLPVAIMAVYSFLEPATYGGVVWNFSFAGYTQILFERDFLTDELVFSPDYLWILWRSVSQAALATALCLLVAVPTAYFIATRPERTKVIWIYLITIPYWVNLLIRTIALLFILRDNGPINSALMATGLIENPLPLSYNSFAIGLGLVYTFLPFMVLPLYSAFERFDFNLLDAAYDLYASRRKAFFRVVLPVMRPGLVAGGLLVFIPAIGSYLAPDILGGGKTLMVGNLIGAQFQGARNWPFGAALSMILLSITLIVLVWLARRATLARQKVLE
jgi:spermidine/putrescine transport system permease protein